MKLLVFFVGLVTCSFADATPSVKDANNEAINNCKDCAQKYPRHLNSDSVPLGHKDPQIQRAPRGPTPTPPKRRKCENGGTSEPTSSEVKCKCKYGYKGDSCETETPYGTCSKNIPDESEPEDMIYNDPGTWPPMRADRPYFYGWPEKRVPFGFDESPKGSLTDEDKEMVRCAINFFHENTCVTFEEIPLHILRSTHKVHMMVTKPRINEPACSTDIYRAGNRTEFIVRLPPKCFTKYHLHHELMHALGLTHVQARNDRDNYITVDGDLLKKYYWGDLEFMRYEWCRVADVMTVEFRFLDQPYDYDSIMHYENFVNVKIPGTNRTEDIIFAHVVGNESQIIRPRPEPSEQDVVHLNKWYQCGDYFDAEPIMLAYHLFYNPELVPDYCNGTKPYQRPVD